MSLTITCLSLSFRESLGESPTTGWRLPPSPAPRALLSEGRSSRGNHTWQHKSVNSYNSFKVGDDSTNICIGGIENNPISTKILNSRNPQKVKKLSLTGGQTDPEPMPNPNEQGTKNRQVTRRMAWEMHGRELTMAVCGLAFG